MADTHPRPDQATMIAAVDIGSNSLRLEIGQVLPDGHVESLERLQRAVRLGQDTFTRNRLGPQAMRAALTVLRDFRKIVESYNVEVVRAVATSAVREASNSDTFLDRVYLATGFEAVVIDTTEESRLTVSGVREAAGAALLSQRKHAVIADVGGGSTLLTVLENGEIVTSQSLRLGSIRLQEMLSTSYEPPARSAALLRQEIANEVAAAKTTFPLHRITTLIAVGGDARFAAAHVGKPKVGSDLITVRMTNLDDLIAHCQKLTAEDLARQYGIPLIDAETLTPALLIYQNLLKATRARTMTVASVSMRDGLLLDIARTVTGKEDRSLTDGVTHSATAIAEKYRADIAHAQCVADIATRLFDELRDEHGLNNRHRLLLQAAALMHEVGGFISNRAHHKHSYYLIVHSEIFGLTREERHVVALVARYHRRAMPRQSHVEYVGMPREHRVLISKLAALLRVADALDKSHIQHVRDLGFRRQDDEFTIFVPTASDLALERKALAAKSDLFEDVFGMQIRLEAAPTVER
jgi:exopolyphosphatase / guanosine-5'-triphosphate,3'-diphosphate pyrophosphatase